MYIQTKKNMGICDWGFLIKGRGRKFRGGMMAFCLMTIVMAGHAQTEKLHLMDHEPLMNQVWKTFDKLMYKVTKKDNKTIYTPHFPSELLKLSNKTIVISGYMVPIETGKKHARFLLSVLPIQQCMYCGQNGIPPMVEINLKDDKKAIVDAPIRIRGRVYLNATDESRTEIQIRDAVILVLVAK